MRGHVDARGVDRRRPAVTLCGGLRRLLDLGRVRVAPGACPGGLHLAASATLASTHVAATLATITAAATIASHPAGVASTGAPAASTATPARYA